MRASTQMALPLPQLGGKRKGAGRKLPPGRRRSVSHKARPHFHKPAAVVVTLRVGDYVWNLRSARSFRLLEQCLADALGRFGLRVIQFTVMGNHIHLIVEADSNESLSLGMQGLSIRIAKALNRLMDRSGTVFSDHFHSRILRTPTELVNAIAYVLGNHAHHFGTADARYSSAAVPAQERDRLLARPKTWLLRVGSLRKPR